MEDRETKQLITNHYGTQHQLIKAIEEMAELNHVVARRLIEDEWNKVNFFEEMADVHIMLDQLKLIFCAEHGVDLDMFDNMLRDEIAVKLNRTLTRIGEK